MVTGGDGFVGSALTALLARDNKVNVRAVVREAASVSGSAIDWKSCGDISSETDWQPLLTDVDAVVHLAARVHLIRDAAPDPLAEFRRVNTLGTLELARQSAIAGVKKLVFLSTVKVNGEEGFFREADQAAPQDPYAASKHEAEIGLRKVEKETGLDVVVIRPPLVYGPGVKANFLTLMRAVRAGVPLPLGRIENCRSMVAMGNLIDLIKVVLHHPAASGETFFVSDGENLSTPALIRAMGTAMDRPTRLIPVPPEVLMMMARMVGQGDIIRRLTTSLVVDISKAQRLLGWTPKISVAEGLEQALRVTSGDLTPLRFR